MSRQLFVTLPITLFVVLFGVSAVIATNFTYDKALIGNTLNAIIASAIVYIVIAYFFMNRRFARRMAGLLVLTGGLFALLFISQYRYQNYVETPDFILALGNLTSLLPDLKLGYLHPNAAATFLEALIPVGAAYLLATRRQFIRLASACLILLMLYAVFLTFSRGAYLGLAATIPALLIVLLLSRLSRGLALAIVTLIVAGAIIVAYVLLTADPDTSVSLVATVIDAGGNRLDLYRNSLFLARDYAFTGIGLGDTFAMIYSRFSLLIFVPFLTYSHNLLLSVWLNQGLLGLVSLLGLVASFYLFVGYVMRRSRPHPIFHGAWLGVTATLVHGLFDARQYTESPWVMPILFLMVGFTVAFGRLALMEEERAGSHHRLRRVAIFLIVGTAVLATVVLLQRDVLVAAWNTNQGALAETRGQLAPGLTDAQRNALYTDAQNWYLRALGANPTYAPANRRLGNLYVERGNYRLAVPLLETAYAAEPLNPAAIKGLGLAYVWVGQPQDAARVLSELPPEADVINELYTWGYFRANDQNRPRLAAYAWETAQHMSDQPNADVWAGIGDFYRVSGAPTDAAEAYETALSIDPDNQTAQDGLAALDE